MYAEVKWYSKSKQGGVLTILGTGKLQGVDVWFNAADVQSGFTPVKGASVCLNRIYPVSASLHRVAVEYGKIRPTEKQVVVIPHHWVVNVVIVHQGMYRTTKNPTWYPVSYQAPFGITSQRFETSSTVNATIHAYEWAGDEVEPERED